MANLPVETSSFHLQFRGHGHYETHCSSPRAANGAAPADIARVPRYCRRTVDASCSGCRLSRRDRHNLQLLRVLPITIVRQVQRRRQGA
ncbi:hypothetical protein V5799_011452 [Amblyomma americanum]|uniref:Uncharacterized protein n=1 Tax=Amblyomma americanum TaxID=6943 RepID=A0AAQ4EGV5_AMBAM